MYVYIFHISKFTILKLKEKIINISIINIYIYIYQKYYKREAIEKVTFNPKLMCQKLFQ